MRYTISGNSGKKAVIGTIVALWLAMIFVGLGLLYNYDMKAGPVEPAPPVWPQDVPMSNEDRLYHLVMIVHPHCPCTRASIGELEILMTRTKDKLHTTVLVYVPQDTDSDWAQSDLMRHLSRIPNVSIRIDRAGWMAEAFGGTTSGQTFLYDPEGQLVFSGGITASRGHAGGNYGRTAIVDAVYGRDIKRRSTPAFGCIVRDRRSKIL
ncbi:MAG: RedB protein [Candidatus Omnitrophica bacterium]|nr:RedB protein [Candidatus Omnitrophota bacterium]